MVNTYSLETARALLELAYPEWDSPPYVIRDDGVYQSDEHVAVSPPEEVFDWSPAYDMSGPDAPDPMTAPMLPIPFRAPELAAFMLDGAGMMIPEALECCIGASAPNLELVGHQRWRKVREALQEAFALVEQAVQSVGAPNYEELASAQNLANQYGDADGLANDREGVFERGVSEDERRLRRARAVASTQEMKERSEHAKTVAKRNWKGWRKKMVHALLGDSRSVDDRSDAETAKSDQPGVKKRRKTQRSTVKESIKPYVAELKKRFPELTGKLLHSEAEKEAGSESSPFTEHKRGEDLRLKNCHRSCSMATFEQVLSQIKK